MTDDVVVEVARAVAAELAPRYGGPRLIAEVEAALHAGDGQRAGQPKARDQFVDPISISLLIVAIAQFGYQAYSDRKKKGQQPTPEDVARDTRIERGRHADLTSEETGIIDNISGKIVEKGDAELSSGARS